MSLLREGSLLFLGVAATIFAAFQLQPDTNFKSAHSTGRMEDRPFPANSATVPQLDWSQDGAELLSVVRAGETEDLISVHSVSSGREVCRYDGAPYTFSIAALLPDHRQFFVGLFNGELLRVGVESAEGSPLSSKPQRVLTAVAVSPQGEFLAGAFEDSSLRVWDLKTGRELASHTLVPQRQIATLRFAPEGFRLVAASSSGRVSVFGAARLRTLREFDVSGGSLRLASFAGNRQMVTVGFDGTIRLHDLNTGRIRWQSSPAPTSIPATDVTANGRYVALGGFDSTITLWDLTQRRPDRLDNGHEQPVLSLRFAPDGKTLASGSLDGTVRLWQVESGDSRVLVDFSDAVAANK